MPITQSLYVSNVLNEQKLIGHYLSSIIIYSYCVSFAPLKGLCQYIRPIFRNVTKELKCKPSAHCACAVLLIDGLGYNIFRGYNYDPRTKFLQTQHETHS